MNKEINNYEELAKGCIEKMYEYPPELIRNVMYSLNISASFANRLVHEIDGINPNWFTNIDIDFVRDNKDKIDWDDIALKNILTEDIIREFQENFDWFAISDTQKLPEDLIAKHISQVDWYSISRKQVLSESFIDKYKDYVNWHEISSNQSLSEEFIERYADKLDWGGVLIKNKLSENFIRKFEDKVNWVLVSAKQVLSEEFIEEYSDKVDWREISENQVLSEKFITKYKDRLDWNSMLCNQVLSVDFIEKNMNDFTNTLRFLVLPKFQKLSEKFIYDHYSDKDFTSKEWFNISRYQILSKEFLEDNDDKISFTRPRIKMSDLVKKFPDRKDIFISIWGDKERIPYNEFLEKYPNHTDAIGMLVDIFDHRYKM